MKAKELAQKYNNSPNPDTLLEICNHFWKEIFRLIDERHAKTDNAFFAILDELDNKWITMANLTETIKPNGFRIIVENEEFAQNWKPKKTLTNPKNTV